MNLTFLNKTDKALHAMRNDQTKDGREARREIKTNRKGEASSELTHSTGGRGPPV